MQKNTMKINPPFIAGCVAAFLAVFKFVFGLSCGSMAIISSAIDSLGDCFVSIVNFFALKKAQAAPSDRFNFGYGKIEPLAALFQALFIMCMGAFVSYGSVLKILNPMQIELGAGILVMIVSILATLALVWYLRRASVKTQSMIVYADALHYEMDLFTNAATLAALVVVHFSGAVIIDALFGLAVSIYIIFSALKLAKNSIYALMDESLPEPIVAALKEIIKSNSEILSFHAFTTRKSGNISFLGVHLVFAPDISLQKAHEVEVQLENAVREKFKENKWIFEIHFDIEDDSHKERV